MRFVNEELLFLINVKNQSYYYSMIPCTHTSRIARELSKLDNISDFGRLEFYDDNRFTHVHHSKDVVFVFGEDFKEFIKLMVDL